MHRKSIQEKGNRTRTPKPIPNVARNKREKIMQPRQTLLEIESLPVELLDQTLYPLLADQDVSALACTARFFNRFYEDGRKQELIRLGFSQQTLALVEKLRVEEKVSFSYKQTFLKFRA